jgi:hypothetical protein
MRRLLAITSLLLCAVLAPAQPQSSGKKITKVVGGGGPAAEERAPGDGLLVGFELSLGKFVDRDVIRSLRPIYRTAEGKEVKGKQYGTPEGKVLRTRARAGYSVGGVQVRTGLLIDGLSVIYMKVDGDRLDRDDTYQSAWVGNNFGGSPSTLAGDGTAVVGFAARTTANNKECSGLGLILR